jgi:hypothetical protein
MEVGQGPNWVRNIAATQSYSAEDSRRSIRQAHTMNPKEMFTVFLKLLSPYSPKAVVPKSFDANKSFRPPTYKYDVECDKF